MRGGIYVHVPYCRRRCPYCDFYFEIATPDDAFADGVVAEMNARAAEFALPAASLSFGGGTPSSLPSASLGHMITNITTRFDFVFGAEISLEANPEDIAPAVAAAWKRAGVTRVSLGIQSFDDAVLRWLGRAHTGEDAKTAVQVLLDAGFERIGVDLIIGVPTESPTRLAADIATCDSLGVGHVSAYVLTVEAGTPLVQLIARKKRAAVDDDAQADALEDAQVLLGAHGYQQYEISNYAREGHESVHNRLYWAHKPYLGLGPGAHSMRKEGTRVIRRHTTAKLAAWLVNPAEAEASSEELSADDAFREAVAFGLRDMLLGVDVAACAAAYGISGEKSNRMGVLLQSFGARGLMREVGSQEVGRRFCLTAKGARFADAVARDVLGSL